jgi:predicted pyridoxine 5'-phosphate oxidase superfamily flavin-nucleotide-binding protein
MGILTNDMMRMVNEQQLGFIATVCPDGTPNLSPKGTTAVWDEEHLVFADVCSPNTIANLRLNPVAEVNVVDTLLRKGYRFKGVATIFSEGPQFEQLLDFYRKRGSTSVKHHIVLVKIDSAASLISPAYDNGQSEVQVSARWRGYWEELWNRRSKPQTD